MQPALAGLGGHGLETLGQIMGFGARDDGVPDSVSARGKALEAVRRHVQHAAVVGLQFVARIAQQQGTARWWRQEFLHAFEAILVQDGDLAPDFQLGHVAGQRAHVRGVQLEGLETVMTAQQCLGDEGRAGIVADGIALVEAAHHLQIVLQHRGQLGLLGGGQAQHAFFGLAALAGVVAVQAVQAGSAVGVEHRQRSLFLREVLHGGNQNSVLEHIGVIACMEGVAVTEHRDGW